MDKALLIQCGFGQARKAILSFVCLFIFLSAPVFAATYTLTSGGRPPCSGTWNVSGTTYTCNGRVTLANGDIVVASTNVTISANDGFTLNNNVIGTTTAQINLTATTGTVISSNTNTIYGSITTTNGDITLVNTTVNGTITTTNNGNINLTGGAVTGLISVAKRTITTSGTNLGGGASAADGMAISGGTVSGNFSMTQNNPLSFTNVTMTSGNISGASTVTISGGTFGTSSSYVSVASTTGAITVQSAAMVYGNLTANSSSTVNVSGSQVYGTCLPNSTPANACNSSPPVCTSGLIGGLTGSYFANSTLAGTAAGTRIDSSVDFNWATGAPGVGGIGANNFSVRWIGNMRAATTGNHRFQTVSDDGVRLYVNNQLVINNWTDHSQATDTSANVNLTAGQSYPVRLEFYENGGDATIRLLWSQPGSATFAPMTATPGVTPDTSPSCTIPSTACTSGFMGGAVGKYYNNMTLSGSPAATRTDTTIDFFWDTGTPGVAGVGADNFSVQWDATLRVPTTGSYQFSTLSDDGVRVWVNSQLIINNWTDHSPTTNTSSAITLTAGVNYPVRVEYYENGGGSTIQFYWRLPASASYVPIPGCPSVVSYYGISHGGSGVTCAASPITITAYDTTGTAVAPPSGTQVTLATTPASGTWVGGNAAGFNGAVTAVTKYLQQLTAATLNINVSDGTYSESTTLDPSITFADSGLLFYGSASASPSTIPTQVAGTTDSLPVLRAVRTDTNTGACVARVTGTKAVNFAYQCVNPITCISGQTFTVNGASAQANPLASGSTPTYLPVTLTFDATGTASIPIRYTDVGLVKLFAQLSIGASGNDPAVTIAGGSNNFVVKPYTLAVTAVQTPAGVTNPGGTSAPGAAAGFTPAGSAFQVRVQAQNEAGLPTPNFGNEVLSENNILLTNLTLVYPSGGTATTLANATSFGTTTPAGTFLNSAVTWNQAGSFTVQPRLADNLYLGAGDIFTPTTSSTIGRFYPDRYRLTSSTVTNGCGTFTYIGQPNIAVAYALQAESTSGAVLTNYGGNYAAAPIPARALPIYVVENNNDGSDRGSRFSAGVSPSWANGVMNVASTIASFARQPITFAPDGPFASTQLGLAITDAFDSRPLVSRNMDAATSSTCTTDVSCTAATLGSPIDLRYGRLRLDDAFGPESVKLPVNFLTEYWIGNRFVANTNDACTVIPRAAIAYPSGPLSTDANRTVALSGGTTQGTYANLDATGVRFLSGTAGHEFSAPTSGGTGNFIVTIDLTNLDWLRSDVNQDNNYSDLMLKANFGFGSYRGNDRVIYWREKF